MPFRQPFATTIRQTNFRGKSCTFPVESILPAEAGGGQVQIDVTSGYVLTSSVNETPQEQQCLIYEAQPDGRWLARGTVTVTAVLASLSNGTVTLRDPQGEAMGIPIQIDPVLFVDTDILSFDITQPNEVSSVMVNVRQQGAVTPVHLSIVPPYQFSLADARSTMLTTAALTISPPFEGSNVIVSYKPEQQGRHSAKLVIATPYDTKTITLSGHTGGLLSWLPRSAPSDKRRAHSAPSQATNRGLWLSALLIAAVGGMLWMGYTVLSSSDTATTQAVLPTDSSSRVQPTNIDPPATPAIVAPIDSESVASSPADRSQPSVAPTPPPSPAAVAPVQPRVVASGTTPKRPVPAQSKPVIQATRPISPSLVMVSHVIRAPQRVAARPAPTRPRSKPHYTVIAGVFSNRRNAVERMQLLRRAGYTDAFVVAPGAGQKGLYKVAATGSPIRAEATAKMGAIRQLIKSAPWLMVN